MILHAVQDLGVGGIERLLESLLPALTQQGVTCRVLCLTEGGAIADNLRDRGFSVDVLGIRSYWDPRQVALLTRSFRDSGAAVIHAHGSFANIACGAASGSRGLPALLTHHHTEWQSVWPRRQRWAERRASRRAARVLCVSEAVRRSVIEAGIAPEEKTQVVYNGVDTDRFKKGLDPRHPESATTIVSVGSLTPHKGHAVLVEAMAALSETHRDLRLILVGDGSEGPALRRLVERLGLVDRVEFAGQVEDVAVYLHQAALFVMPSVLREGLGIALIEAMSAGVPVVATRCGGIPELIQHRKSGLLVPPGDAPALAAAIHEVLGDDSLSGTLATEAQAEAIARFDISVTAGKLERLYREISDG